MKHCVIYIPGLGDRSVIERLLSRLVLKLWRLYGVRAEMLAVRWYDGLPFDEKRDRILAAVDEKIRRGYTVSLIGASAGASMAINVAAARPEIWKIVTVAGVSSPFIPISPSIRRSSPAFVTSCESLATSIARVPATKIHTISALSDSVVGKRYSFIEHAHNHRLLSAGHLMTIALCLTLFSPYVIFLIRRRR